MEEGDRQTVVPEGPEKGILFGMLAEAAIRRITMVAALPVFGVTSRVIMRRLVLILDSDSQDFHMYDEYNAVRKTMI